MSKLKGSRGRPGRKIKSGERVMLGLRVTPEMKGRLDEAAQHSGRSQSQEAELRLERSFDREDLLSETLTLAYGPRLAGILLLLGAALQETGRVAAVLATPKPAAPSKIRGVSPSGQDDVAFELLYDTTKLWLDDPFAYDQAMSAAIAVLEAARPAGDPKPPAGSVAAVNSAQGLTWSTISANAILHALKGRITSSHLSKAEAERVVSLLGHIADRMKARKP